MIKYTEDEMSLLAKMYDEYYITPLSIYAKNQLRQYCLGTDYFSIFQCSYEDIPLFINSPWPLVVKWRLKIGK